MIFTNEYINRREDITAMFEKTFSASEGPEEASLIETLVNSMLFSLSGEDIYVFSAVEEEFICGSIIFTKMLYEQDERIVYILSPVAVANGYQGKGVGQSLIKYGLKELRDAGVDIVLTYGDINFYSKVGFYKITELQAASPLALQYPEGWLGQSLKGSQFEPLKGKSHCVAPLNDSRYW
jgi:predicted N-acetyltransferase YhbS